MSTYEATCELSGTPEEVWNVLSDVVRWPQWLPTVAKVIPSDVSELHVGSRYQVHQPRLRPLIWTVTEAVPMVGFTWETRSIGLRMVARHHMQTSACGQVRVVLQYTFAGFLSPIISLLFGGVTESYLAQEARALKRRCELG